MAHYHYPLDPKCPVVLLFDVDVLSDAMVQGMDVPIAEIRESFEQKHGKVCERCRKYSLANVEIKQA
jgi:hypothetical protein